MGNLLTVKVHAANIHDTKSGCHVYQETKNKYPAVEDVCADAGYRGTFVPFVETKFLRGLSVGLIIPADFPKTTKSLLLQRKTSV